jgi:hypothetical protein
MKKIRISLTGSDFMTLLLLASLVMELDGSVPPKSATEHDSHPHGPSSQSQSLFEIQFYAFHFLPKRFPHQTFWLCDLLDCDTVSSFT